MEQGIRELSKKVDDQGIMLQKVLVAVTGDPTMGLNGIKQHMDEAVGKIEGLDTRVEKLEDFNKKTRYLWTGASAAIGLIVGGGGKAAIAKIAAFMGILIFVLIIIVNL